MFQRFAQPPQVSVAVQVFSGHAFDFQTVRSSKASRAQFSENRLKVHPSFTQGAELPFSFATLRILQMHVYHMVYDLGNVLCGIDIVVVINNVARVVVEADVGMSDFLQELSRELASSRRPGVGAAGARDRRARCGTIR